MEGGPLFVTLSKQRVQKLQGHSILGYSKFIRQLLSTGAEFLQHNAEDERLPSIPDVNALHVGYVCLFRKEAL